MHRSLFAPLVAGLSLLASVTYAQTTPPVHRPNPAEPVFSAQLSADQHALLNWRVSPKHAPLYFEVERSGDGRSYSVADRQPYQVSDFPAFDQRDSVAVEGPTYYRLCLVARDYSRSYTASILLRPAAAPAAPATPIRPSLPGGPTPPIESGYVGPPATIDLRVRRANTGELVDSQTVPYASTQVCWGNLRRGQYVLEAESAGRTWVTKLKIR